MDGGSWTVFAPPDSIKEYHYSQWNWSLDIDANGRKWLAFAEMGVVLFDGGNWTHFTPMNSDVPYLNTGPVLSDPDGSVWFGTQTAKFPGGGLLRYADSQWQLYDKTNSPVPNDVLALALESNGNLWIGSRRALAVYREGGVILGRSTAVEEERGSHLPSDFAVDQNYPNPFNSSTSIRFSLPKQERVDLTLYNLAGQEVVTLTHGQREAGTYTLRWDGRDDDGRELASGVYLYRLQAGQQVETRKLVLVR